MKTIEPQEIFAKTGYSRPHTVHCGPDAIYVSALGSGPDGEGPGGIFMLDHFSFDVLGPWEIDRGAQCHIFWDQRADWLESGDSLPRYASGDPALAKFKAVKR